MTFQNESACPPTPSAPARHTTAGPPPPAQYRHLVCARHRPFFCAILGVHRQAHGGRQRHTSGSQTETHIKHKRAPTVTEREKEAGGGDWVGERKKRERKERWQSGQGGRETLPLKSSGQERPPPVLGPYRTGRERLCLKT